MYITSEMHVSHRFPSSFNFKRGITVKGGKKKPTFNEQQDFILFLI